MMQWGYMNVNVILSPPPSPTNSPFMQYPSLRPPPILTTPSYSILCKCFTDNTYIYSPFGFNDWEFSVRKRFIYLADMFTASVSFLNVSSTRGQSLYA